MRSDPERKSWFRRLSDWADRGAPDLTQEVAEDPERAEFMEYLQYLERHDYLEFGAYRLMRYRERAARGEVIPAPHGPAEQGTAPAPPEHRRRHRPGSLRRMVRLYRALSAAVAAVMMAALVWVSVSLPAFGDPEAPAVNEVSGRYLERGVEETGAVNVVTGLILDYRAFDTFGESTVLFAATMSVVLLMRRPESTPKGRPVDRVLRQTGRVVLPPILMFGIYVVLNGHLSPGGGFSGGTVLGCGLILSSLVLGRERMDDLLPPRRLTLCSVVCLLAYGGMKGYSFFTGANHVGWDVPKGTPGDILSAGFILPLNICVGVIVACTMYTFYSLFARGREPSC